MSSSRLPTLLLLAACSRPGEENLGLGSKPPGYSVDVARLARPGELQRALALPGRELDKRLGARRMEATSTFKIEAPGKPAVALDETFRMSADGQGALHLLHDNSHGYGVEAIVTGGELFVRPRYQRFVRRRPEGDELDRLRATVENVPADYLALVGRWLQVREEGSAQVAGRSAVRFKLALAKTPAPARPDTDPSHKWRESVVVRSIDGEALVDAGSGAPLGVRLEATYAFQRDGQGPLVATLSYRQTTRDAEPIAAPAEFAAAPKRVRPMLDRQELLEGLR